MKPYKPIDRDGKPIKVGDFVRIIGVPDSGVTPESLPVFQYLVGKYKHVMDFDKFGCAELTFKMRDSDGEFHHHAVWIEPFLLHVPQPRSSPIVEKSTS